MRTTLDLEEDVLLAVKEIARQRVFRLAKRFRSWPDKPYLDKMLGRRAMVCHFPHPAWGWCRHAGTRQPTARRSAMTAYLLDVNVLPLSDPMHIHHEAAHRWFAAGVNPPGPCPITENGLVRIASHPNYPNRPGCPGCAGHPASILCDGPITSGAKMWHSQVAPTRCAHLMITDVFLLGLAIHKGGKLATFDQRISTAAVQGGEALELIAP